MTANAQHCRTATSSITRNSLILLAGQYFNRILTVAFFAVISRMLSEGDIGRYAIATTFASIVTALVAFGVDKVVERRVARQHETAVLLVRTAFVGQIGIWVVSLPIALTALSLLKASPEVIIASIALLPWVLGTCLITVLGAAFRGLERMEFDALMAIIAALQVLVYAVIILLLWRSIVGIVAVMVLERAVTSCVGYLILLRVARRDEPAHAHNRGKLQRELLRAALPFAGVAICSLLYQRIDVLILASFVSETRVGHYATAYRVLELLMLLPGMIASAAFPLMARSAKGDLAAYRRYSGESLQYSLALIFPVIIGTFFWATPLIGMLFGSAFTPAGISLRVLVWGLVFQCINNTVGRGIIAGEGERHLLPLSLVALGSNLALNFVLIPRLGELGAAWATVGSFAVSTTLHLAIAARLNLLPAHSKSLRATLIATIAFIIGTVTERFVEHTAAAVATIVYLLLLERFDVVSIPNFRASIGALRRRVAAYR